MVGDSCHHDFVRCSEINSVVPRALTRLDCPPIVNQVTLSARLNIPISLGSDWTRLWQTSLSSAVANVLGANDLCLSRVLRVESVEENQSRVTIAITRPTVEESEKEVARLVQANEDGTLLTALTLQGVPVAQ